MDWYWGLTIVFICFCIVLLLRYCKEQCKAGPDYRTNQPYNNTSAPAAPPGFTVLNQRVPLRPTGQPVRMPMPTRGFENRGTSSLDHISRTNPYPPVSREPATAPYPLTPFERQLSSTAEDLPPSYNDVIQQSSGNLASTLRRPYSEGNVNI